MSGEHGNAARWLEEGRRALGRWREELERTDRGKRAAPRRQRAPGRPCQQEHSTPRGDGKVSRPSATSWWPYSPAWLTWWNKYGHRPVGVGKRWGVGVSSSAASSRLAWGLLEVFMTARPVQAPMIRRHVKPGHGVPAHHSGSWRHRSGQCRVPDRLRAAGRPASLPLCPAPRPRRTHRLPAASPCAASGDRTGLAASGERRIYSVPRIVLTPAQLEALGLLVRF